MPSAGDDGPDEAGIVEVGEGRTVGEEGLRCGGGVGALAVALGGSGLADPPSSEQGARLRSGGYEVFRLTYVSPSLLRQEL